MFCTPYYDCKVGAETALDNPDISGIGVVIGFVATAWAALLALVLHYIADPEEALDNKHPSPNPLDYVAHKWIWNLFRKTRLSGWTPNMESVVLAMSDQQLVTGLAVLISGYSQLHCGVSSYHWQAISTLAWFASITHISTLRFLAKHMQRNQYVWHVRLFLMAALAVLLAVAMIPTGSTCWYTWTGKFPEKPAVCCFDKGSLSLVYKGSGVSMIISEIIILGGFILQIIRLIPKTKYPNALLNLAPGKLWRDSLVYLWKKLQTSSKLAQVSLQPLVIVSLAILLSLESLVDFLESDIWGLSWLLLCLIWGTLRLSATRSFVRGIVNVDGSYAGSSEEDIWNFGQLTQVLLLILPVLLLVEECSARKRNSNQGEQGDKDSATGTQLPVAQPLQTEGNVCLQFPNICKKDFRSESWYLENMLCAMVWLLGIGALIIPIAAVADNNFLIAALLFFAIYACVSGFFCLLFLPLCRIFNLLVGSSSSWHRHQLVSRIALDPGKKYRVARWSFLLSFIACGIVVIPCSLSISGTSFWVTLTPLIVCSSVLLVLFLFVLLTGFYSILF